MRFEVLGSLRAVVRVGVGASSAEPNLGGPKQRLVLALLLSEPNTVVTMDRLVEGVWADRPPGSARHTLQAYISELRKAIGPLIQRDGSGYVLTADASSLDSLDFEKRIATVRRDDPTPSEATVEGLEAALELWRGGAFQDFPDHEGLRVESARLEELRLTTIEELMSARLAIGRNGDVAADLDRLIRDHPYREEFRALLMLALYRAGRQVDALRAYRTTRDTLTEDLGIEPSPRLRRLHEQILLQDPDLDPRPTRAPAEGHASGTVKNPYLGLRAFHEEDEARFFGREDLVGRLIERMRGDPPLTAVVGPSGSGKSSVVSAGLIPQLRRNLEGVLVASMQPGTQPLAELDAAIAAAIPRWEPMTAGEPPAEFGRRVVDSLPLGSRFVLVVDQFEELYTMVDDVERGRFLETIVGLANDTSTYTKVVLTVRADFYDRPLAEPGFGAVFADNVVNVVPLDADQLEAAAIHPARQVDVELEPRLIARLIRDVTGQPNALPMFQYALTELFEERAGGTLDVATYERIGGVRKAIARRAEGLYQRFDAAEQGAACQLMLRISTVSDELVGRRRVPASELMALDVDVIALNSVIEAFSRHRLIALDRDPATNERTVEVAHEALLQEWDRLRRWVEQDRDDLQMRSSYLIAVGEWERSGRDAGYLLSGTRLDDYERWARTTRLRLTAAEREYIDISAGERTSTVASSKRRRRRSRLQLALLAAVAALLAAVVAYPIVTRSDPDTVVLALEAPIGSTVITELLGEGLDVASDEYGFEGVVLEPPYSSNTEAALREVAAGGADVVIGVHMMSETLLAIAPDYPDTTFVALGTLARPSTSNAVAVNFAVEQAAFLAGAAAALETTTGKIGYIGFDTRPELEQFRAGFEHGARTVDPGIEVVPRSVAHHDDTHELAYAERVIAQMLAANLYEEHDVDIIFTTTGGIGAGTFDAAIELSTPERHLWGIGVDSDEFYDVDLAARDHVLTSVLTRYDAGVTTVGWRHMRGEQLSGRLTLGLADGAVGYSTSGNHLGDQTIGVLDDLSQAIVRGELIVETVPVDAIDPDLAAAIDLEEYRPTPEITRNPAHDPGLQDRIGGALEALEAQS